MAEAISPWGAKAWVGFVVLGLLGCAGEVEGQVGEQRSALVETDLKARAAGSLELTQNGQLQQWVVICDESGKIHHRVKVGTANWGDWINDGLSCSGAPSLAPWRSRGNELVSAYYRKGYNLMETTWRANGDRVTANLSTDVAGLGTVSSHPIVSYFDVPTNRISLLTKRWEGDEGAVTSLDYYDGGWHMSQVYTFNSIGDIKPFFSKHTSTRYFIIGSWIGHTPSHYQVFHKVSDTRNYTARTKFVDAPADMAFGGFDATACRTGCYMTMTSGTTGKWTSDLSLRDMDWWQSFITFSPIVNTPRSRAGGDLSVAFAQSAYDPKAVYKLGLFGGFSGLITVPGVPYSPPLPVSNVYHGSIYEQDAYFAIETPPESLVFRLYRVYEQDGFNRVEDMGRNVKHAGAG